MRASAQVGEIPLFIEGNRLSLGKILDQFHFIFFVVAVHQLDRLLSRKRKTLDGQIALDNLLHFRFDLRQVVLIDGRDEIDVVIEAVFDDGANGKLARGIYRLKRLRQHVGTGMAVNVKPLFVLQRDDLQRVPLFQDVRKIDLLPVHLRADGVSRQALGNCRGRLQACRVFGHLHSVAVLQNDVHKYILRISLSVLLFSGYKKILKLPQNNRV